jgi:hypothetical protein
MLKVLKVKGTMIKRWIRKSNKAHNLKLKFFNYIGEDISAHEVAEYISQ